MRKLSGDEFCVRDSSGQSWLFGSADIKSGDVDFVDFFGKKKKKRVDFIETPSGRLIVDRGRMRTRASV